VSRFKNNHSDDALKYLSGPTLTAANVHAQVRQAILDNVGLHPDILKGKWRRRVTELTRHYQRKRCLTCEHAEAKAFEDVLCVMWLDGEHF
jgi:hypothetical protein